MPLFFYFPQAIKHLLVNLPVPLFPIIFSIFSFPSFFMILLTF